MKNLSRRAGLVATLAIVPLALASCSGGSDSASGDGESLTVWHFESDTSAMGQAWDAAIKIFKDEHPGVDVVVENQTFEAIQKNAKIVLTGDDVPDVMEYNKGNATAGQLASQGLLADLTDYAEEFGWDDTLSSSLQTTAKYDEAGLMGSGDWYGVPNYGEYVSVFYNKDMFAAAGVEVPTTLAEFETVMDTFVAQGITPLAEAGAEYPLGQLWYDLVLANADRGFVDDYQLFANDVDFHGPEMTAGTETLAKWIDKGYVASDVAGLTAEDMGTSFISGTYPMMVSGSWWFGRLADEIQYDWGQFKFPGSDLQIGSSGNLWVVPENSANKDLAADFIDITLRPEVQNILGEKGGLPVAGDPSVISDPKTQALTEGFNDIIAADGLAFYPDWPVAGFYDVVASGMQSLANQSKSPAEVLSDLESAYAEGRADLLEG
ncbi:ABC transporter substrate-binding protein [Cellulomonas sp. P22]|uniref:ABC transporter substrate-binding protein n=1 Tax=Cellulomonas sp. P22 TaxID=3373189 RepID=UPI0037B53E88